MEGVLNILQSVCRSDNYEIYLSAFQEHQSFQSKVSDEVIQHISSMLNKPHMYREAFLLLNCYLKQASFEVLQQKFNIWTTLTIKAFNSIDFDNVAVLVYSTLSSLVSNSIYVPEISKSFAHNHLPKIYESLIKSSSSEYLAALQCTEVCLRLYPGPSGPFRNSLEKYLCKFIDTTDVALNIWCGKCMLLLQQIRGGGIQGLSHKSSWFNYQENLINNLHNILNIAFSNCTELYDKTLNCENRSIQELVLDHEPAKRALQVFIRFRNIVNYFTIALRNSFPVAKPVATKKIINLISRGLNVTCPILSKNPTSDHLALGLLIPKMHILLFDLLKALILTLKTNLKAYHTTILRFIVDTLQWTSLKNTAGSTKSYTTLRCKAYEILSIWCATMKTGSKVELVIDEFVEEIINDVMPFHLELTLKVLSGSKKHMSKKAKRQLYKTQNEQSNLSKSHANDNSILKQNVSDEQNVQLCVSALQSLQEILISAANFLKPNCLKILQIKILDLCGALYTIQMKPQELYYNWKCRLEMYKVLYLFIIQSQQICPSPTQIAFNILQTAQICDRNATIRIHCQEWLMNLEKLIHPHKENLLFPSNIRGIQPSFVNYRSNQFLRSRSTSANSDVDKDMQSILTESNPSRSGTNEKIKLKQFDDVQDSQDLPRFDVDSSSDTIENITSPTLDNVNDIKTNEPGYIDLDIMDDHGDKSKQEEANVDILLSAEPSNKKPKLSVNEDSNAKSNSKNVDCSKSNVDDEIFAEIEGAFVDELN